MIEKWSQRFSFTENFRWFGLVSLVLVAVGLVSLLLLPFGVTWFNLDIDFLGGTTMTFETYTQMTRDELDDISALVESVTGRAPSPPQKTGESGTQVFIRSLEIPTDQIDQIYAAMTEKYPDAERLSLENIGSTVGKDLQRAAVIAVGVAALLILLYIAVRFTFSSGLAAVVALIHDLLLTLSVYVIFQIPMNMNFIAVMLTILGYSINSSIIVFDRVRENRTIMAKSKFSEVVDRSIWQTVKRNLNTNITTLLPVIMLIILGVSSVRNFIIPLAVGIVAGAYSSICLAAPLWNKLHKEA